MSLALAGLLALSGCGGEKAVVYETELLPANDGAPATLSLYAGELYSRPGCQEALTDIIQRYQADYPNTQVELLGPETGPAKAGSADIIPVAGGQSMEGLLDFSPYLDAWENEGALTAAGRMAMHCRGGQGAYAVPLDMTQLLLFYRVDWAEEYNQGIAWRDQIRVETWEEVLSIPGKLGERGRLLIAEGCHTGLLEASLWSTVGVKGLADLSLGFYVDPEKEEPGTLFAEEKGKKGLELFQALLEMEGKTEASGPSPQVQAFIDGESGLLIAENTVVSRLTEEMPAGVWAAAGLPTGESGTTVAPCQWTGLGVREDTAEPEKAVHFLAYLTNVDNNTHMAKACGFLPIYRESPGMEPALGESLRAAEAGLLGVGGYYYAGTYDLLADGDTQPLMEEACARLQNGDPGEELLSQLDKEYMKRLNGYLEQGNPLPWGEEEEE